MKLSEVMALWNGLTKWQQWLAIAAIVAIVGVAFFWVTSDTDAPAFTSSLGSGNKKYIFPVPGWKVTVPYGKHKGYDIWAPAGTPIYSGSDGVVSFVGSKPGSYQGTTSCGVYVEIWDKSENALSTYCHMSRTAKLTKGQTVMEGQLIGYVGMTGNVRGSNPTHLHITLRIGGRVVDPGILFPKK